MCKVLGITVCTVCANNLHYIFMYAIYQIFMQLHTAALFSHYADISLELSARPNTVGRGSFDTLQPLILIFPKKETA
ncbi:MAG: hypothetical protein MJZ92_04870 [Paludibacteraceae bacterium]|nr:hypothetical protein [Paludibacteraceae bacterium]